MSSSSSSAMEVEEGLDAEPLEPLERRVHSSDQQKSAHTDRKSMRCIKRKNDAPAQNVECGIDSCQNTSTKKSRCVPCADETQSEAELGQRGAPESRGKVKDVQEERQGRALRQKSNVRSFQPSLEQSNFSQHSHMEETSFATVRSERKTSTSGSPAQLKEAKEKLRIPVEQVCSGSNPMQDTASSLPHIEDVPPLEQLSNTDLVPLEEDSHLDHLSNTKLTPLEKDSPVEQLTNKDLTPLEKDSLPLDQLSDTKLALHEKDSPPLDQLCNLKLATLVKDSPPLDQPSNTNLETLQRDSSPLDQIRNTKLALLQKNSLPLNQLRNRNLASLKKHSPIDQLSNRNLATLQKDSIPLDQHSKTNLTPLETDTPSLSAETIRCLKELTRVDGFSIMGTLSRIVRAPGVLRELLQQGVKPDQVFVNSLGQTSSLLHQAVTERQPESVRLLVENPATTIDLTNHSGETPLKLACKLGLTSLARCLVDRGADVNHQQDKGVRGCRSSTHAPHGQDTPLMAVCRRQHLGVAKLLLKAGCNVHLANSSGRNALHIACADWNLELLRVLLKYCSSVETPNNRKETPLFEALGKIGHLTRRPIALCIRLVYELVLSGAKMNTRTVKGVSPMMLLIQKLPYLLKICNPGPDKYFYSRIAFLLDCGVYDEELRRLLKETLQNLAQTVKPTEQRRSDSRQWQEERTRWLAARLKVVQSDPPSLQHACLVAVRRQVAGSLREGSAALPLPALLQKYLCQSDDVDPSQHLLL